MPTPSTALKTRLEATPVLIAYVVALLGIPSELVFRPLGAAGTPAQIIGIGLLVWWVLSRLPGRRNEPRSNPVKWLLLIFALTLLASYVAGMSRPIIGSDEVNSADRALLSLCAWAGVVLVIADGLPGRRHLDLMLRTVAGGVTAIAVLGVIQFFFRVDIAHLFQIPGLTADGAVAETIERSSFRRVTGTTQHPIEFGVVLSAILPLVIHHARFSATIEQRRRWWIATAIVGFALPMSVARSAVLGGAIAILYLFHTWPARLKLRMLFAGGLGIGVMSAVVPGLLGTFRYLIFNASSDPSTQGRTADYGPVFRYLGQRPVFGRGFGTFIPSTYRTLDNQWLGILVEAGIVGVVGTVLLLAGTMFTAGAIRRRTSDERTRDLAQCLKAGIMVVAVNAFTFDALGFAMCAGILFLLIGATAALRSFEPGPVRSRAARPVSRTRSLAVLLVIVLGWGGAFALSHQPPVYNAVGEVILQPNVAAGVSKYDNSDRADVAASILHDVMVSDEVSDKLAAHGVSNYTVALGDGSLMMGTDRTGTGPLLRVRVSASSAAGADTALQKVLAEFTYQFEHIQAAVGLSKAEMIKLNISTEQPGTPVFGRPSRAEAALVLILLLLVGAYLNATRRRASLPGARTTVGLTEFVDRRGSPQGVPVGRP